MSEIFERAALVTPIGGLFKVDDAFGGAYSHADHPMFAAKASGSRIIGVDGSEYIDLVCGGGVCTLGYAIAAVDDEVKKRIDMGDCVSLVDESYITLAETVVRTLRSADWATFCSDGHQAVTMAIMAARYYTQRKKLLFFKDSLGGVVPVLARADDGGVLVEDVCNNLYVDINDVDTLRDIVRKYEGEIAAFVATPYLLGATRDVLPEDNYWKEVRHICTEQGILLIFDESRTAFRLSVGGADQYYGIQADMICLGRGMANGYPIACLAGADRYRSAVAGLSHTEIAWRSGVACVAAIKTLECINAADYEQTVRYRAGALTRGISDAAENAGRRLAIVGDGGIFRCYFEGDDGSMMREWCRLMSKHGVLISPVGECFVSYSLTDEDVKSVVAAAERSFAEMNGSNNKKL